MRLVLLSTTTKITQQAQIAVRNIFAILGLVHLCMTRSSYPTSN